MKFRNLILTSFLFAVIAGSRAWADGDSEKDRSDSKEKGYASSEERRSHDYPYSTGRPRYYCGYYGCSGSGYYGYNNGYHGSYGAGWSRGGWHYGGSDISRTPYTPPSR